MIETTGVTIGEKPSLGGRHQVAGFFGHASFGVPFDQALPPGRGEGEDRAGGGDSTLLRHGTQWEIRYLAKSKSCVFIVWHDKNVFTEVRVPIKAGEWTTIAAEYAGDGMLLQAGDATAKVEGELLPRLFSGSLANIRISLE